MEQPRIKLYHEALGIVAVLAASIGFVASRGIFSFGVLAMGLYSICHFNTFVSFLKHPWFLSSLALPLFVFFKDGFCNVFFIDLLLPLILMFTYCSNYHSPYKKYHYLILMLILSITAFASIYGYLTDVDQAVEGYKRAKVLPLGFFNDHVRTCTAIAMSVLVAIYILKNSERTILKWLMAGFILFQIVFLHFISSRIGLVALYSALLILIFSLLFRFKNYYVLLVFIPLMLLPVLAFKYFPSFYHRMGYTYYDFQYYKKKEYRPGSSDGIRYYSIMAGIDIFKDHKISGAGFEGMKKEASEWYTREFPTMPTEEQMLPHSQYVVYAAAGGVIGLLLLLLFLFMPLFNASLYSRSYATSIYISLLFICLIDVFLDSQIKIFVLAFFLGESVFGLKEKTQN